jgi:hypothetical protein
MNKWFLVVWVFLCCCSNPFAFLLFESSCIVVQQHKIHLGHCLSPLVLFFAPLTTTWIFQAYVPFWLVPMCDAWVFLFLLASLVLPPIHFAYVWEWVVWIQRWVVFLGMIFKLLEILCFFCLDVNVYLSIYFGETFFNVPSSILFSY